MVIFREKTTVKLFKEVDKLAKKTFYEHDSKLRGKQLKSAPKLYNSNTANFEPIEANREHLIKTLMPMVIKIAKDRSKTYVSARIEFDDCISAGMQGAIIATDIYIEKSKTEQQPAKLSTYAFSYIVKYINEYIYNNTTSLSHGVTKGREAMSIAVLAGNKTNENAESGTGEYFETSNEPALMNLMSMSNESESQVIDSLSAKMFQNLTMQEKSALFMFFGVSCERKYDIKEIATYLHSTSFIVENMIHESFKKIRQCCSDISDKQELIEILLSGNLNVSLHWQKP